MNLFESTLSKVKIFGTFIGTCLTYLLGGFDQSLIFLVIAMSCDYVTGVIKGWYLQEVSSRIGFKGIAKKVLIIILLIIAVQLDMLIPPDEPIFRTSVCWFFIANECISIVENCGAMGLPIPDKLKNALAQIKKNNSDNEVNNNYEL